MEREWPNWEDPQYSLVYQNPFPFRSPPPAPSPNAAVARPLAWVTSDVCGGPKPLESTLEGGFTLQRSLPRRVAGWITTSGG
ncbi:hypothetical protein LIA77_03856 [Sarocladium implicatum]|nr:hypothetical protein LIA77_03856 [Sarocladium implicatum]